MVFLDLLALCSDLQGGGHACGYFNIVLQPAQTTVLCGPEQVMKTHFKSIPYDHRLCKPECVETCIRERGWRQTYLLLVILA
jgi:hypothetical protein